MRNVFGSEASELEDLFLAPLEAVIKADIELSEKVSDFIIQYGFTQPLTDQPGDNIGSIKLVTFSYGSADGLRQISLPVLSLIQLPLLKIKGADFNMRVKLVTTVEETSTAEPPPSLRDDSGSVNKPVRPKARIKAFLSPESRSVPDTMKANMKVNLSMSEGDMPGGILNLLNLMNNSAQVSNRPL